MTDVVATVMTVSWKVKVAVDQSATAGAAVSILKTGILRSALYSEKKKVSGWSKSVPLFTSALNGPVPSPSLYARPPPDSPSFTSWAGWVRRKRR